jgi:Carboxypeptidase regulatory-like domain
VAGGLWVASVGEVGSVWSAAAEPPHSKCSQSIDGRGPAGITRIFTDGCNLKQLIAVISSGRTGEHGKMVIVRLGKKCLRKARGRGDSEAAVIRRGTLAIAGLSVLLCGFPARAAMQAPSGAATDASGLPDAPRANATAGQQADAQAAGSVSGYIVDPSGAAVVGARVTLTRGEPAAKQEVMSGDDGQFSFLNIAPGAFTVTIVAASFAAQTANGILHPGEIFTVPTMALALATEATEVRVVVPTVEVAADEIKEQEKQRVLGVIPNFYVSYVQDAAPLTSKQKFGLAWKTTIDPVNFAVVGVIAGVQQWQDNFKDYGQGAQGYGKRYGASYGDFVTSTFFGGAVLPSLLKQDPRYFYKGTGTVRERVWYAVSMAVMCKGDNRRWQFNYSAIGGSLISGGISNAYYPDKDRGADLVFENTLIGIGENAATNLLQEFVIRKLTPAAKNSNATAGQP